MQQGFQIPDYVAIEQLALETGVRRRTIGRCDWKGDAKVDHVYLFPGWMLPWERFPFGDRSHQTNDFVGSAGCLAGSADQSVENNKKVITGSIKNMRKFRYPALFNPLIFCIIAPYILMRLSRWKNNGTNNECSLWITILILKTSISALHLKKKDVSIKFSSIKRLTWFS